MTERQKSLFKQIVEYYIETGEPVGSKNFVAHYQADFSSATIRNEMSALETEGYLEKAHISSGRIPTTKGYKLYASELSGDASTSLALRLDDLLARRRVGIDLTIDEAVSTISELAGVTMSLSSTSTGRTELMKSMQLTPVSSQAGVVVIVTSSGRVESKLLNFSGQIVLDDVRVAVRLFTERLVDTPLNELSSRVTLLKPILAERIKNYEAVIQAFARRVFDFHEKVQHKVFNNASIIKSSIDREDLAKLIDLLQNRSVWESIEESASGEERIKIDVRPNNVALLSRRTESEGVKHEISVVGSPRMNYSNAKAAITLVEKYLKLLKEHDE